MASFAIIRTTFAAGWAIVSLVIAAAFLVVAVIDPHHWYLVALTALMLGKACLHLAASAALGPLRSRIGISPTAAIRAYFAGYMIAGVVAVVAALLYVRWPFGLIVAFGAFSFAWAWGYFLLKSHRARRSTSGPTPDKRSQ